MEGARPETEPALPSLARLRVHPETCEMGALNAFLLILDFFAFSLTVPRRFCALCFQYSLSVKHLSPFSSGFGVQESWQVKRELV